MNITIFNDFTTDDYLKEIESEAAKYDGLYVDMDNKEERKFVKDKASSISSLLKKLERARIDKNNERKIQVEEEAKRIKDRLEAANKPFSKLIDEHKEKRAKELAEIKKAQQEADLKKQIESDHEEAITLDKIRDFELREEEIKQQERDKEIAAKAREEAEKQAEIERERAEQAEIDKILAEEKAKRDAKEAREKAEEEKARAIKEAKEAEAKRIENERIAIELEAEKREADKNHMSKVCGEAKESLMKACDIGEELARDIIKSIAKKEVMHVKIEF